MFLFKSYPDHRDLHSFPTRRSSDLEPIAEPRPGVTTEAVDLLDPAAVRTATARLRPAVVYHLAGAARSEEHTSELQSRPHLVCRLLLEKKKRQHNRTNLREGASATR